MDIVTSLKDFNAGRDPQRLHMKYRAMRISPFAFLRGTCHLFYERLPRRGLFRNGPLVWACGDLHLQNFGSYKADNRLVYFDLNDFDEAALAPASWDLVRLLCSLHVGAEDYGLTEPDAEALAERLLHAYATALVGGKAMWVERETAQGPVRAMLDALRTRNRAAFLDSRTQRKARRRQLVVDNGKALVASAAERATVEHFMVDFAQHQPEPAFFKVLDVARRIAGTGSLGVPRYVILVEGKGSPDGNVLLDLKRAAASSLLPHLKDTAAKQPRWPSQAQRVVTLQRRAQAVSMAFLHPVSVADTPFVLRSLQPSEDRVRLEGAGASVDAMGLLVDTLGRLTAWAHLRGAGRQGSDDADALVDYGHRTAWRPKLMKAAQACARQVHQDAQAFSAAFDAGAFGNLE